MSKPFLSTSWYRVEGLKPALKADLRVTRHRYWGGGWYVVEDPIAGKVHRFTPAAYLFIGRLDGSRTVDEAWRQVAEALGEDAPTQDETLSLLGQLHGADLLTGAWSPDVAELLERHRRQARQIAKSNLLGPLSFRIPIFDPDPFLSRTAFAIAPLVGWLGVALFAAVVVPALLLAGQHWAALTENLSDRVLAFDNLLLLAITYPVVKIIHELGHGYMAKSFGASVREFGIMFLVFFPVPYVDASAASALPSKYQRAAVSAAGILAEVFLAACALHVWVLLEPGIERAIAFNVMVIGGVSTVLVNGNPLLRFDGYFILSDLIESPNLSPRANRYLGYLVERFAFGVEKPQAFEASTPERAIFLIYAPVSFVYRILVLFWIAMFIATKMFIVGIVLALWAATVAILRPIGKGLWRVYLSPQLRRDRRRAVTVTSATLAVLAFVAFVVPAPHLSTTQGVVWLPEAAHVRAEADGFIAAVAVSPGARVAPGTTIATLGLPAFSAKLEGQRSRVKELELRHQKARTEDPATAQIVGEELNEAKERLARDLEIERAMTVTAASHGTFVPAFPLSDLVGRYVQKGTLLGHVLPDAARTLRIVVTQEQIDLVRGHLRSVEVRAPGSAIPSHEAELLREVPAAQYALPSPALAFAAGGPIATDPRDPDGTRALNRVFQFDVALPEVFADEGFGRRLAVRFRYENLPVGWQILRWARRRLLTQFGA